MKSRIIIIDQFEASNVFHHVILLCLILRVYLVLHETPVEFFILKNYSISFSDTDYQPDKTWFRVNRVVGERVNIARFQSAK